MPNPTPEQQIIAQQTVTPEYPDPTPLTPDANKPTPYPVDALPPILRDAIKAIAEFEQVPLALAGQAVLAAAGHVAQTRVDAWSHVSEQMPCTLWQLSLGASGEGKSSAYRQAFHPIEIREWKSKDAYAKALKEHNLGKVGLKGKALKEHDQTNPPPYDPTSVISGDGSFSRIMSMFVDGTSALFWNTDEGGQMLSGHSMKADNHVAVLGSLAKLWDDGKGERLRAKDNADGSGSFQGRRLSLSLMAQEVAIREVLNDPIMREQGFLPRFLFSAPESLVGSRKLTLERLNQKASDLPAITNYWARLDQLLDQPRAIIDDQISTSALPVSEEAKKVWQGYWQHTEHQQARFNDYEALRPFASRAAQNTLRIATVLAFFDKRQQVDAEMMQAAYSIADHSLQEWKRYADTVVVSPAIRDALEVFEWLTLPTHKTPWDRFHANRFGKSGLNKFRPAQKRNLVLGTLLAHHYLIDEGGNNYAINPKLLRTGQCAESADSQTRQGLGFAETVLMSAEKCRNTEEVENPSAANPQPSATANTDEPCLSATSATSATIQQGNLSSENGDPQPSATFRNPSANETPMNSGYPQLPQNPQPLAPESEKQGVAVPEAVAPESQLVAKESQATTPMNAEESQESHAESEKQQILWTGVI